MKEWFSKDAPEDSKAHAHYCNIDEKGLYCMDNVSRVGGGKYSVINPINGKTILPPSRGWVYGKEEDFWKAVSEGKLMFQDNDKLPILKRYLHDNETQLLDTVFYKDRRGAKLRLRELLGGDIFDFPKDETIISNLIDSFSSEDSLVLDFFSGSATTAHSVLSLNAQFGSHRKFILVQLPELTDCKSAARKAGYNTICEIGKERIRRAGQRLKDNIHAKIAQNEKTIATLQQATPSATVSILFMEDQKEAARKFYEENIKPLEAENSELTAKISQLDIGFRVLKLADSNMEDVFYAPDKISEGSLFVDNVKADRTSEDLLFQVMLELGVELSSPIEKKQINGKEVFSVRDGFLTATFDENVDEATITEIAKSEPVYFVMRDASAANDNVLDNFEQLFRHYSPDTIRRIL
jgi:adenine-specific DNA-methyltransferase